MTQRLGIMVCTNKYLDYVINTAEAANRKGLDVQIFFTGQGVLLTQDNRFKELVDTALLYVCDVSFRSHNLHGDVPGVGFKQFVTQARNAEMIEESDRFLVF